MSRDEAINIVQGACNCLCQEGDEEPAFSYKGCKICNLVEGRTLGADVVPVSGYNPVNEQVEELGDVCMECLCYVANGE